MEINKVIILDKIECMSLMRPWLMLPLPGFYPLDNNLDRKSTAELVQY